MDSLRPDIQQYQIQYQRMEQKWNDELKNAENSQLQRYHDKPKI